MFTKVRICTRRRHNKTILQLEVKINQYHCTTIEKNMFLYSEHIFIPNLAKVINKNGCFCRSVFFTVHNPILVSNFNFGTV